MRKVLFLFGVLDDRDVEWLASAGRVRRLAAGEVLIQRGQAVDAVWLVLDGVLAVEAGAPGAAVARLQAGEVVGEMSFVDSRPPSATVEALRDTRVLEVPRAALHHRLGDPAFAARFYHALALFLAHRLRATTSSLGHGPPSRAVEGGEELDPLILDKVNVAGARFEHLLRRLAHA
jgi:CRP/FNR family transcriptional regulator, cyclic AMP receptor protein